MKLTVATLAAALIATTAAADNARYDAVTGNEMAQQADMIPDSNARYKAVNQPQTPEPASKGTFDAFEAPGVSATQSASQGHIDYLRDAEEKQDLYR